MRRNNETKGVVKKTKGNICINDFVYAESINLIYIYI